MTTEQEILAWPLQEVQFPVTYSYYEDRPSEDRIETLFLPPAQEWLGVEKGTHYDNLMNAIQNSSDFAQRVMKDLYRNVALGNFTIIPSEQGAGGSRMQREAWLRKNYPDQETLRGFVYNLSTKTTLCGLFIYNLLKRGDQNEADYRMLGAVLHTFREKDACPKRKVTGPKDKESSPYLIELKQRQVLKER